jgi:hypothetical protein
MKKVKSQVHSSQSANKKPLVIQWFLRGIKLAIRMLFSPLLFASG